MYIRSVKFVILHSPKPSLVLTAIPHRVGWVISSRCLELSIERQYHDICIEPAVQSFDPAACRGSQTRMTCR